METMTWLQEAYKEEWASLIPYLIACLITFLVTRELSRWFDRKKEIGKTYSKIFITLSTRILDITTYTSVFISLLILKDRILTGPFAEDKDFLWRVVRFLRMSAGIEVAYISTSSLLNYYFLKVQKMTATRANTLVIIIGVTAFSLFMPPIKHFFTTSDEAQLLLYKLKELLRF